MIVHAMVLDHPVGFGQHAVAAELGSQVDDDRSLPHGLDHSAGDELRCIPAGNDSGRDDDVDLDGLLCEQGQLRFDEGIAHDLRVATRTFAGFLEVEYEELPAKTLNLFLHGYACIEGADNGSKSLGGSHCSQPCYATTDDQYLGGINPTSCGHLST